MGVLPRPRWRRPARCGDLGTDHRALGYIKKRDGALVVIIGELMGYCRGPYAAPRRRRQGLLERAGGSAPGQRHLRAPFLGDGGRRDTGGENGGEQEGLDGY